MLYKDVIKELAASSAMRLDELAAAAGMKPNTLYQRLKESWNPRIRDMQPLLDALGYEIAFVPKGMIGRSGALSSRCYVPEFPDRPGEGR